MFLNIGGFFQRDLSPFAFPSLLILVGVLIVLGRFLNWPRPGTTMQTPAEMKSSTFETHKSGGEQPEKS